MKEEFSTTHDDTADVKNLIKQEVLQDDVKTKQFECAQCNVKFAAERYLKLHVYRKHKNHEIDSKTPSCVYCNIPFKRRCDMLRHIRRIHNEPHPTKRRRRTDIEYKVFCDICNLGYTRRHDMEKHRKSKHPDAGIASEETLIINQCSICKEMFTTVVLLKQHLNSAHDFKENTRLRRKKCEIKANHYCDVCKKGFTRKFDMKKHRLSKHPDAPPNHETFKPTNKNTHLLAKCKVPGTDNQIYYKCETCGKLFRQSYNFIRHQTIHTGVRAFFCHICGKNFRVLGGLQRHINEHHYGVKKYGCEVCGKKFAAKSTRDDHLNIHSDTRPFVCDICGKTFRQKASLHIHKLFHTNNYRFSCNLCGKKFRRGNELKVHSYLHTGHKPHKCELCGAMFRLGQDLKRHAKVHVQFVCVQCGRSFSHEKYLNGHVKEHHEHGAEYVMCP